jgi:hypothetical protein
MRSRIVLLAVGLALGLSAPAAADIGPPRPRPPVRPQPQPVQAREVAVKIEVDENAKGPKLILPANAVNFNAPRPNGPFGQLEQENGDAVATTQEAAPEQPRHHVLIAGVAVALAFSCGGLWMIRRNGKGSFRNLALLIAAGATLAAGAIVWANAPPPFKTPPPIPPQPKQVVSFPAAYEGKATIEMSFGQGPVRLILDKESYEKLKKSELKSETKPTP